MSKFSLFDRMVNSYQHNEEMPLKGHLKMILEDVRDGTQEVTEVDNLVTNAVANIFSKNYSGMANFSSLFPLRNLYGGIMCFQNQQTENANNYKPQNDLVNPLIAHAGDVANNTGSRLRGSPVANDYELTDTAIKQVWLWDNTQGVGHIESVSLCSGKMGNMGLKPYDTQYNPLSTFGNTQSWDNTFNETRSKRFPFNISDDGKTSVSVWLSGDTFKEYKMRHDYTAFGIMRTRDTWQDISNRSATVRTGNNRFVFDDANYYYIARAYRVSGESTARALAIDKVSKETFAVTQADCVFTGIALWDGNLQGIDAGCRRIWAFDGTYLYYPNSNLNGFIKLDISGNDEKIVIDGTIDPLGNGQNGFQASNGEQFITPVVINDGLILGSNYIINGNNAYQIKNAAQIGCEDGYMSYQNWLFLVQQGAACYGHGIQTYTTGRWAGQSNVLNHMYLGTIANLPKGKDKRASQTMRIEYTLTEQT